MAKKSKASAEIRQAAILLKDMGVTKVTVVYSGSGDEGCAEDPVAFNASGAEIKIPDHLSVKIKDELYEMLPSGWELNSGSSGTYTMDLVKNTAKLEHSEIVEETVDSEEYFNL